MAISFQSEGGKNSEQVIQATADHQKGENECKNADEQLSSGFLGVYFGFGVEIFHFEILPYSKC
jgi:hypothetical protein